MGHILKDLCSELLEAQWLEVLNQEERGEKRKSASPLPEVSLKKALTDG